MSLNVHGRRRSDIAVSCGSHYLAVGVLVGSGLLAWPGTLLGQVGAAGFGVGASVIRSCDIETTPLAFGVYDPLVLHASQPLDREASVTFTCTKGTPATLSLNGGLHASGAARYLSSGSAVLQYELFKDAGRTQRWGEGDADALQAGEAPSQAPRTFVVFGRILPGQDIPVGTYTDSVVLTVEF